ncbi:MAG: hypothetical protein ACRD2Z_03040 [Thermoanaerobaculia bacterium]
MESHETELDRSTEDCLAAVAVAAAQWGAEWQPDGWGGRITLPVIAGLRRGHIAARIHARPRGGGTHLTIDIESIQLTVNRSAVAVLAGGGVGGLAVALWPFWPPLLGLAPLGAVLAVSAWFLVNSRLRHSGVEDFLELVREEAREPGPGEG